MSGTRAIQTPSARSRRKEAVEELESKVDVAFARPPRADLLPPEVRARGKQRSIRRAFILGILLAVAVVGAAYTTVSFGVASSSAGLAAEQARSLDLLAQQQEYVEVRQVQAQVDSGEAAARVSRSTQIDWQEVTAKVQATLPAGVALTALTTVSATPIAPFVAPENPLTDASVASGSYTATSPNVPETAAWAERLLEIPGVTDVTVTNVIQTEQAYTVDVTIYLDTSVLTFAPIEEEAP